MKLQNSMKQGVHSIGAACSGVGREVWALRRYLNPVHARYHGPGAPLGIRCANAIIGFMGSWLFLGVQTLLVFGWIVLNVTAWVRHVDPYPFILLNLAFSTQAAYAAPLILMASNVSAARDRDLWEHDYATNQQAYAKIEELEKQIAVLTEQNSLVLQQSQQLLQLVIAQQAIAQQELDAIQCQPHPPR